MIETGVYAIINTINGHIYIGGTTQVFSRRWYDHKVKLNKGQHGNKYLQRAWKRYGEESFDFCVLERLEEVDDIFYTEQAYLDTHYGEGCYNIAKDVFNPMTNRTHDEATRKLISEKVGARFFDANYREEQKAIRSTEEARQKQREITSRLWENPEYRRKVIERMTGIPKTEEMKKKMSESAFKRWSQEGARESYGMRRAKTYGGLVSPEGEVFDPVVNLRLFCRTHNLHRANISKVLSGEKQSHKGWTAKVEDEN